MLFILHNIWDGLYAGSPGCAFHVRGVHWIEQFGPVRHQFATTYWQRAVEFAAD